jgi:serine/threonine-protein kinase RsbW
LQFHKRSALSAFSFYTLNTQHQPPPQEVRLEVENNFDGFKQGTKFVRDQLAAWNIGERPAYIAELALDELLTNIIRYAYTDKDTHTIGIGLRLASDDLTLSFDDDGQPFDPVSAAPLAQSNQIHEARIGGRGLIMIRSMAQSLRYEHRDGRNHLFVVIKNES